MTSVQQRWSAQDYVPADSVPYVGRLTRGSERLYVATGLKKWGMTNGTAAAMMISDAILARGQSLGVVVRRQSPGGRRLGAGAREGEHRRGQALCG